LRFKEWEPIYAEILNEFGFSMEMDEEAALLLSRLAPVERLSDEHTLSELIEENVTVIGDAPGLANQIVEFPIGGTVIAADGATSVCLEAGVLPQIVVTDLDGLVLDQIEANRRGSLVIIHAHGDNIDALRRYVPRFEGKIMITTQSKPFDPLFNWGGFTDGDRAVIMAIHYGARSIDLMGFDFDNPRRKTGMDMMVKRKKLAWARRLIFDLHGDRVNVRLFPMKA